MHVRENNRNRCPVYSAALPSDGPLRRGPCMLWGLMGETRLESRSQLALLALVAGLCASSLCAPSLAAADDTHHQPIFVGSRAMGMGTAFTGVANDASSLYHNPAGVLSRRSAVFSGGFWVNAFDTLRIEEGLATPDGYEPITSNARPSVPSFGSFLVPFGAEDVNGDHRGTFGITAFRLRNDRRSFDLSTESPGSLQSVDVEARDQINYFGVSLAYASSNRAARFGISLFLSQRLLRHRETLTSATGVQTEPGGVLTRASIFDVSNRLRLKSFDFIVRLGFMHKIGHSAHFGLMLQSPGIPVHDRVDVFARRIETNEFLETEDLYLTDEDRLDARSITPAEVRMGIGWTPENWVTVGADFSVIMPIRSHPIVSESVPGLDRPVEDTFLFYDVNTRRRVTWNAAVGVEFVAEDKFLLRFGGLTDRSSAHRLGNSVDRYRTPRVHRYGFSASIGFRGSDHGIALGAVALFGQGRAVAADVNRATGTLDYFPTDARSRLIVFQLSGSTAPLRFIARGATDTLMGSN